MSTQLSILFYSKTSKKFRNGTVPIYIRITVNGIRLELSTNRQIRPQKWSKISGSAIGNSEESQQLNQYLDTLRHKVY
ncbi:MAG TPA: Arm DNA-binding domain-containing protein, partial [Puia sp.]